MDVTFRERRSFDASSPVMRYWLSNCVGFAVSGGRRGHVEAVVAEDDPREPEALLVRSSSHRVRRVPISAVVAVVPAERVLVVGRPEPAFALPELPRVNVRPAARVAAAAARTGSILLGRFLVWLSAHVWWHSRHAWDVGAPVAAAWSRRAWAEARRGGEEGRRLIASVPWHRFGPSVRSATTRASQELSRRWSLLRTTSSRPSSAADSPAEANTTSST